MGSSFAAGPGIGRRAQGSTAAARRSGENYAHLVAGTLGLDLVDVTHSGATTANVLAEPQGGEPPQLDALTGAERLVTITIGGNDIGYVQGLMAASLPAFARGLPVLRDRLGPLLDRASIDDRLRVLDTAMRSVAGRVRDRAPKARVVFVEYLTVLPDVPSVRTRPISRDLAAVCRYVADRLAAITADAACTEGCEVVHAAQASMAHHAWSARPWTTRLTVPLPGRPAPYHPNRDGMRAVAAMVATHLNRAGR
ncbi:MAG: SGNH/GDSL hydrolase family protein [Actinomycetota bacterium]|nr:SGNH/GDSL hydrolase family protein [Actinomycetota bacterium]